MSRVMTGWRLLYATKSTRILIGTSAGLQLGAIIAGYVLLQGAEPPLAARTYLGIDLPNLLYAFPYRIYIPACEALLGRAAIVDALTVSTQMANAGYLLWLAAMPVYFTRVLKYGPTSIRVYRHVDDQIGELSLPEDAQPAALVHPQWRTRFYAFSMVFALVLFGNQIYHGSLADSFCGKISTEATFAAFMPGIQILGFFALECVVIEVIAALWLVKGR